jgi:hypothetical protein
MGTDAELVYSALLRAERRLSERAQSIFNSGSYEALKVAAALEAVNLLREEIGNGISRERPQ